MGGRGDAARYVDQREQKRGEGVLQRKLDRMAVHDLHRVEGADLPSPDQAGVRIADLREVGRQPPVLVHRQQRVVYGLSGGSALQVAREVGVERQRIGDNGDAEAAAALHRGRSLHREREQPARGRRRRILQEIPSCGHAWCLLNRTVGVGRKRVCRPLSFPRHRAIPLDETPEAFQMAGNGRITARAALERNGGVRPCAAPGDLSPGLAGPPEGRTVS